MKNIMYILLMLLFGGALFSCSSSDGDDGSVTAIELSVDKAKILADGQDVAVFKVMDNLGTDLTNQCVFTVNNEVYSGNTFVSTEEGIFRVRAQWQDFESNLVSITVVDESNVQLSFTSDKQEIWADGGDGARLSVTDNLDRDLTEEAIFYVNGEVYESSFFTSKTEGQYLISAEYDGKKVGNVLRINAKNELPYVFRILLDEYSGTWCVNCPPVMLRVDEMLEKYPDLLVPVSVHVNQSGSSTDPFATSMGELIAQKLGVTGTPSVFLNRNVDWDASAETPLLTMKEEGEAEVNTGIGIDSHLEGNELVVTAYIRTQNARNMGCYVILTEDGLEEPQAGMDGIYTHNNVARAFAPEPTATGLWNGVFGIDEFYEAGLNIKEFRIPWKEEYKQENCHVVVGLTPYMGMVTLNVNRSKIGERIGY